MLNKILRFNFSQFVKLTRMDGKYNAVAKLELDNPKKKNALSVALLDEVTPLLTPARCHCAEHQ